MDGQIITCVFCGQEYPIGTPTHGSEILEDQEMQAAIESFQCSIDALLNRGWCRNFLGPFDGCEALVLLHYHRKPVKATFCCDWDGGWFAELVDGELLPVRPLLFLPLSMPR